MAKGKYALGKQYHCERCGNQIKVLGAGGGNLICCVKAMQPAPKEIADGTPTTGEAPAVIPNVGLPSETELKSVVLDEPAAKLRKSAPVDPADLHPVYFYDVSEFGADQAVRKQLFNQGSQSIDLICLRYGQELPARAYDVDQAILLIEGRGTFTLGDRQEDVSTGASLAIPAGVLCGIKNTSPDDMFVMAVSTGYLS